MCSAPRIQPLWRQGTIDLKSVPCHPFILTIRCRKNPQLSNHVALRPKSKCLAWVSDSTWSCPMGAILDTSWQLCTFLRYLPPTHLHSLRSSPAYTGPQTRAGREESNQTASLTCPLIRLPPSPTQNNSANCSELSCPVLRLLKLNLDNLTHIYIYTYICWLPTTAAWQVPD